MSAPLRAMVQCTGLGDEMPAVCVAANANDGSICRCRPAMVKVCTMAAFATEAPLAGDTFVTVSRSGALAVPQLGFASELPQPNVATAPPTRSPNSPAVRAHMRRIVRVFTEQVKPGALPVAFTA